MKVNKRGWKYLLFYMHLWCHFVFEIYLHFRFGDPNHCSTVDAIFIKLFQLLNFHAMARVLHTCILYFFVCFTSLKLYWFLFRQFCYNFWDMLPVVSRAIRSVFWSLIKNHQSHRRWEVWTGHIDEGVPLESPNLQPWWWGWNHCRKLIVKRMKHLILTYFLFSQTQNKFSLPSNFRY